MDPHKSRKKSLTKAYREQAKVLGAYCIRNTKSQKCFVGVSRDVVARLNRHRFSLKTNTENLSRALQEDWRSHGDACFEFEVLETIDPPDTPNYDPEDDLEMLLAMWVDELQALAPTGYNE